MDTLLEKFLDELRAKVSQMAGYVEEAIQISTKALAAKDVNSLETVFAIEKKINEYHKNIDRTVFKLLARQSPVASDLRMILAIGKINVDLERMGDLARTIAFCVRDYLKSTPVLVAKEVPKMADLVRSMVRKSLEAFTNRSEEMAREVLALDDAVDRYRDTLLKQLREQIKSVPQTVDASLELLTVVRNLERLGDHATNIAEEVIFSLTGKDIRHTKFEPQGEENNGNKLSEPNPGR